MFAKMPEGLNNPNSPDFPGLNSTGGPNYNSYSDNSNNYNNNNMDYSENIPNPNLINKVSQNVGGSWLDNINCNLSAKVPYNFVRLPEHILSSGLEDYIKCKVIK